MNKPEWFHDGIPLDPLIAPMVFFLRKHGVKTTWSCQGGPNHLSGRPTVHFLASTLEAILRVEKLLEDNDLLCSAEVSLTTGFFKEKWEGTWEGQVQWLWGVGHRQDVYTSEIYPHVLQLVEMEPSTIADETYMKRWHSDNQEP
jgi:hypothetical protein